MSISNKINDVLTVDAFKDVFQRRSNVVLLPDVLKLGTVQKSNPASYCLSVDRTDFPDSLMVVFRIFLLIVLFLISVSITS